MTVSDITSSITHDGNGLTTNWPYGFRIDLAVDARVGLFDIPTGVFTELNESLYSITGLGVDEGGEVVYPLIGAPITADKRLVIWRELSVKQTLELTNQTPYYPNDLEDALDRTVMQIQQLKEESSRSIKVTLGSDLTPDEFIQELQEGAANAAASASAALASANAAAASETNSAASATAAAASAASASADASATAADASTASAAASTAVTAAGTAIMAKDEAEAAAVTAVNVVSDSVVGAVRHDVVQTLTSAGKTQARNNVGAASAVDIRRNLWVNGSFGISQENGNTLGTANGYYPADQVALYFTAATAAISVQRIQARTLANALDQIEFKTTTAKAVLGASDFVTLTQNIEGSAFAAAGFGTAAAVPLVLRAEVKLPAGTYHFHVSNSAANRHCAIPFTITGAEINTPTVKEIIVPPDTSGTWLTADGVIGITCDLVLAAGSSKTGGTASTWGGTAYLAASTQKNILDSTANVVRLADVGIKLDPDATGVYGAYEVGEVDAVYRAERYLRRKTATGNIQLAMSGFGYAASGGTANQLWVDGSFSVEMCKAPTGSISSAADFTIYASATTLAATGLALNGVDRYGASWITTNAGYSAGIPGMLLANKTGAYIQYNARLS